MNLLQRLFGPNLTKEAAIHQLEEARDYHMGMIERIDRRTEELKRRD